MHDNSTLLFSKYALGYFKPDMRVLEVGGRTHWSEYSSLIPHPDIRWDTVDLKAGKGVTHVATGEYSYPIADNTYDIVLAVQVLEHVRHPWRWFSELARVTAVGGYVITVSPVSWPFHEFPVDCWRVYPDGMKALCEEASLDVRECICSSEESTQYWHSRYGRGRESNSRSSILKYRWYKLASFFGYPVEVALDTILIAQKRERSLNMQTV
jgi:SAM-dependent methyltransferase